MDNAVQVIASHYFHLSLAWLQGSIGEARRQECAHHQRCIGKEICKTASSRDAIPPWKSCAWKKCTGVSQFNTELRDTPAVCKGRLYWETPERNGGWFPHLLWVTKGHQAVNKPAHNARCLGRGTLQLPARHGGSQHIQRDWRTKGPHVWCCLAGVALPAVTLWWLLHKPALHPGTCQQWPSESGWCKLPGLRGAQVQAAREVSSPRLPSKRGSTRAATSDCKRTCCLSCREGNAGVICLFTSGAT